MEQTIETLKRKGSMLEDLAELIFKSAGFEITRNKFFKGYEVDLMVSFGDRNLIIECKQYERSYLPIKNLILQWKGKNEIIKADGVVLFIYGVSISEEEYILANEYGIKIWGEEKLNSFLLLINDKEKLSTTILNDLKLQERDIAETNEKDLKGLIWKTILTGNSTVSDEAKYGLFRKALRHRMITNLKQFGSTPELREKHYYFFENVIKETETKKAFFIFTIKSKLNEKAIWQNIKNEILQLKPFEEKINEKYLGYMRSLEDGFNNYYEWFIRDTTFMNSKYLIAERVGNLNNNEKAIFYLDLQRFLTVEYVDNEFMIRLAGSAINDLKILEWILTDTNYKVDTQLDNEGKIIKKVIWHPTNLDEAVDYTYRILSEYFGMNKDDRLLDRALIDSLTEAKKNEFTFIKSFLTKGN